MTPALLIEIPAPAFVEVSLSCFPAKAVVNPLTELCGKLETLMTPALLIEIPVPAFVEVSLSCLVAAEAETAV